jgi:hypothetical protein
MVFKLKKLFFDSEEELGDYISKNIKDINTKKKKKKKFKFDSTVRIIILNSLDEYTKKKKKFLLNNCTCVYLMINELKRKKNFQKQAHPDYLKLKTMTLSCI